MNPIDIGGRALRRNTLINFAGHAGPFLIGIVLFPFIIQQLGAERFGLLSIAWIAPELFAFIDLGLGRATTKYAAEALAKGDDLGVSKIVWTVIPVQMMLGGIGTIIAISSTPFLTDKFLNISAALRPEANEMFHIIACSIPLVLVSTSMIGLLGAGQRFGSITAVSSTVYATSIAMILVGLLFLSWTLAEIATLLVAARLLALVAYYRLCIHTFPSFKMPRFDLAHLPKLLTFGGWLTASSVAVPALLYADRFVIGATLNMAAVAYYSVPYEIATRLWIVPASVVPTVFPAFSMLATRRQLHRLKLLVTEFTKWVNLVMGSAVLIGAAFAREILHSWVGPDFAREGTLALQIIALGIFINSMVQVQCALVQALGRPDVTAKLHLIQLPLHAVLVWWFVSRWGVTGAAMAQAIRLGIEAMLFWAATCRVTSLPFASLLSGKQIQGSLLLLLMICIAMAFSHLIREPWLRLILIGMGSGAGGVAAWRYCLNRQERDKLIDFLRPLVAK